MTFKMNLHRSCGAYDIQGRVNDLKNSWTKSSALRIASYLMRPSQ